MTRIAGIGAALIVAGTALGALSAFVFSLIWNAVVPAFGGPEISFWLAWGILFLLSFLGGAFRGNKA
jgi:hypothetical protein